MNCEVIVLFSCYSKHLRFLHKFLSSFVACVDNIFSPQVQDKFRLDLTDEEAVQYLQSLIDESVSAMLPVVVEQFHKMAQVSLCYIYVT